MILRVYLMNCVQYHLYIKLYFKYCDLVHRSKSMGYHSFSRNYPEAKSPLWPYYFRIFPVPLLQLLGAEKGQGAGVQSMALNSLVIALSAVSTYEAR